MRPKGVVGWRRQVRCAGADFIPSWALGYWRVGEVLIASVASISLRFPPRARPSALGSLPLHAVNSRITGQFVIIFATGAFSAACGIVRFSYGAQLPPGAEKQRCKAMSDRGSWRKGMQ